MTAPEPTPAVERAALAIKETVCTAWPAYVSDRMAVRIARDGLTAALPTECHEAVADEDGEEQPCDMPAVAYREDKWEPGAPPYPVCAKHATPDLVPLTTAILGEA